MGMRAIENGARHWRNRLWSLQLKPNDDQIKRWQEQYSPVVIPLRQEGNPVSIVIPLLPLVILLSQRGESSSHRHSPTTHRHSPTVGRGIHWIPPDQSGGMTGRREDDKRRGNDK